MKVFKSIGLYVDLVKKHRKYVSYLLFITTVQILIASFEVRMSVHRQYKG